MTNTPTFMKRKDSKKERVLLVNITRLGDMLQATPTICGIKAENPNAKITVLVEKQFEQICHYLPGIDEVVALDLGMTVRSLAEGKEGILDAYAYISEVVEDLRAKNFDYCLNMSSSAYTALLLKLVGVERNGGWTSDEEGYRVISSEWAKLFAASVFHQNRQYNSLNLVDIFRCSADVEMHPHRLQITIPDDARQYAVQLISEAGFTNTGPLIAVQAGASQQKRQWIPSKFVELCTMLVRDHNARIVLTGTAKESHIIDPIIEGCNSPNVFKAAGRTTIPQLAALLEASEVLVTGDTGTMHLSVAAGTPVISMFVASAFGYETGPYGEGNIVLQPIIACGPCNPNKPCSRPDCHDTIAPQLVAELTALRLAGDFATLPKSISENSRDVVIYRSTFDEFGFCTLQPLNKTPGAALELYRTAYRSLWLDDIGGVESQAAARSEKYTDRSAAPRQSSLNILGEVPSSDLALRRGVVEGLEEVITKAEEGKKTLRELIEVVSNPSAPAKKLGEINQRLSDLDREIEEKGYNYPHLGPLTRMFCFGKENISGTDVINLASQMEDVYESLRRRGKKLEKYVQKHVG